MAQTVKDLPAMLETQVQSLACEDPLEKGMTNHFIFLPGEFHGQMSLAGYNPWGRKKSDTTERLTLLLLLLLPEPFSVHLFVSIKC